jgi:hypothetical protein
MASGAGLNRTGNGGGVKLLSNLGAGTATVATPLTGYGTIGVNDSGYFAMPEAIGSSKWTFQLVRSPSSATTFSGLSVTIYGTIDSRAYADWKNSNEPAAYGLNLTQGGVPQTIPADSWFVLPSPSDQTGAGAAVNPLTAPGSFLYCSLNLVAVRAVLTGSTTPTGSCDVIGFAVP